MRKNLINLLSTTGSVILGIIVMSSLNFAHSSSLVHNSNLVEAKTGNHSILSWGFFLEAGGFSQFPMIDKTLDPNFKIGTAEQYQYDFKPRCAKRDSSSGKYAIKEFTLDTEKTATNMIFDCYRLIYISSGELHVVQLDGQEYRIGINFPIDEGSIVVDYEIISNQKEIYVFPKIKSKAHALGKYFTDYSIGLEFSLINNKLMQTKSIKLGAGVNYIRQLETGFLGLKNEAVTSINEPIYVYDNRFELLNEVEISEIIEKGGNLNFTQHFY